MSPSKIFQDVLPRRDDPVIQMLSLLHCSDRFYTFTTVNQICIFKQAKIPIFIEVIKNRD